MILVRNVFHLKYGQAKPAVASIKEARAIASKAGAHVDWRFLTDFTGRSYTLVLESTFANLGAFEAEFKTLTANEAWHAWYAKFQTLVDSGSREIYNVVE